MQSFNVKAIIKLFIILLVSVAFLLFSRGHVFAEAEAYMVKDIYPGVESSCP